MARLYLVGFLLVAVLALSVVGQSDQDLQDDSQSSERTLSYNQLSQTRFINNTISVSNSCSGPIDGTIDMGTGRQNGWTTKDFQMTPLSFHLKTQRNVMPCSLSRTASSSMDVVLTFNFIGKGESSTRSFGSNFYKTATGYRASLQFTACQVLEMMATLKKTPIEKVHIHVSYKIRASGRNDDAKVHITAYGHKIKAPAEDQIIPSIVPNDRILQLLLIRSGTTCAGDAKCVGIIKDFGKDSAPQNKVHYVSLTSDSSVFQCSLSPRCDIPAANQAVYHSMTRPPVDGKAKRWIEVSYSAGNRQVACLKKQLRRKLW